MSEYYVALFYYYRGSSHALHALNSYSTWGTLSRKVENKESKSGFKPIGPQHWSIIYSLQCKATGISLLPLKRMLIHSRLNLSWERHFEGSVFCPQCDAIQWPGYRLIIDPSCLSPTNKHQTKTSLVRRKVRLCTPKFPCTPFTDTQLIFISP